MSTPSTAPASSPALSTDCFACRLSGTITFAGVGVYALTVARNAAKTSLGRASASAVGVGLLSIAAARWTMKDAEPEQN